MKTLHSLWMNLKRSVPFEKKVLLLLYMYEHWAIRSIVTTYFYEMTFFECDTTTPKWHVQHTRRCNLDVAFQIFFFSNLFQRYPDMREERPLKVSILKSLLSHNWAYIPTRNLNCKYLNWDEHTRSLVSSSQSNLDGLNEN